MGSAHPETVSNRLPKPRPIRILGSAQCFYVEKSSSNGLPKHGSHFASDETRDANLRPLSFLCVSSGGSHHHELGDDRSRGGARGRPSPGPSSPAPGRSAPGPSSPAPGPSSPGPPGRSSPRAARPEAAGSSSVAFGLAVGERKFWVRYLCTVHNLNHGMGIRFGAAPLEIA